MTWIYCCQRHIRPCSRERWRAFASSSSHATRGSDTSEALGPRDEGLLRVYLTACNHQWGALPSAGRAALDAGCSKAELRATVRHMPIFAGYAPCLAACKALHKADLLGPEVPAKIGGQPGDAFELVYAKVRNRVWENLYQVDAYVSEAIRVHGYGDVYSSPGLDLRQKQLFAVGFLGTADMLDELFGHMLAALRFGVSQAACSTALDIAFDLHPSQPQADIKQVRRVLAGAARTMLKNFPDGLPPLPSVTITDPGDVKIPCLPPAIELDAAGQRRSS